MHLGTILGLCDSILEFPWGLGQPWFKPPLSTLWKIYVQHGLSRILKLHLVCAFRLLTATIAWPVPWVVQVGVILSTLGAALQSLTGAPRLLAAIANDDIIPVLKYFKAPDDAEPHFATLFTMLICASCVILGNLDLITPVITMFFLLCYGGVNLSCLLLDLLDAPSWRPRFKFHHWSFSLVGALLCISKFLCLSLSCMVCFQSVLGRTLFCASYLLVVFRRYICDYLKAFLTFLLCDHLYFIVLQVLTATFLH
jgi:amino acid transporter